MSCKLVKITKLVINKCFKKVNIAICYNKLDGEYIKLADNDFLNQKRYYINDKLNGEMLVSYEHEKITKRYYCVN